MKKYPIQVLFREYLEGILAAVFLALFLRFFVISVLYIPTDNMSPTLARGDFVLGWRLAYGFPLPLMKGERLNYKAPHHGDLVSLVFPGDDEQVLIRRIVALEGDQVMIRQGVVYVNGRALSPLIEGERLTEKSFAGDKAYEVTANPLAEMAEMTIPAGSFFVLSDHRGRRDDSRDWGVVPVKNLESRISLIWLSVSNRPEGLKILWDRHFTWVQ